jgi:hypothetical protein
MTELRYGQFCRRYLWMPAGEFGLVLVMKAQENALVSEREHQAVQLALAGATFDQIAQQVGYANRSAAWKAVQRALARVEAHDVGSLREVEGARLDRLQVAVWPAALRGEVKAATVVLRIMERRARLLGLDAPLRADVGVRPEIDAGIRALVAQLGGKVPPRPAGDWD